MTIDDRRVSSHQLPDTCSASDDPAAKEIEEMTPRYLAHGLLLVVLATSGGAARGCEPPRKESTTNCGSLRCRTDHEPKWSAPNPCPPGKPDRHVVRVFFTKHGIFRLRCGDESAGHRHIAARGRTLDKRTYDCIRNVLKHGNALYEKPENGKQVYQLGLGGQKAARVVVIEETRDIVSVFLRRNARWSDCAGAG